MILPDLDNAEFDIKGLSAGELEKVPFDIVRWQCKIKFCKCYTRMRDYGMHPVYYHKRGVTNPGNIIDHWINIDTMFLMCSKHYKRYKNKVTNDIPLKRYQSGMVVSEIDCTKKEKILV
jgi:hypothetical protein